jgi:CBS domain containing-hemolysin-like protein
VLFIIDARCGGNNDNPWTSNNYRELVKNIERWITKNVQWNTILLLPPNLLASNILSKLQLNSEHM